MSEWNLFIQVDSPETSGLYEVVLRDPEDVTGLYYNAEINLWSWDEEGNEPFDLQEAAERFVAWREPVE